MGGANDSDGAAVDDGATVGGSCDDSMVWVGMTVPEVLLLFFVLLLVTVPSSSGAVSCGSLLMV